MLETFKSILPALVKADFPNLAYVSRSTLPVKLLWERFKNSSHEVGGKSRGKFPLNELFDPSRYFNLCRPDISLTLPDMWQLEMSSCSSSDNSPSPSGTVFRSLPDRSRTRRFGKPERFTELVNRFPERLRILTEDERF